MYERMPHVENKKCMYCNVVFKMITGPSILEARPQPFKSKVYVENTCCGYLKTHSSAQEGEY